MVRFLILIIVIILILFVLKNVRKKTSNNSNLYKNLILVTLFIGVIFLIATSGKFILPQFFQILKIALPFMTKFIGI